MSWDQFIVQNVQYDYVSLTDGDCQKWKVTFRGKDVDEVSFQNVATGNYFAWNTADSAILYGSEPYWWHLSKSGISPDDIYTLQVAVAGALCNLTYEQDPQPQLVLVFAVGEPTDAQKWKLVSA